MPENLQPESMTSWMRDIEKRLAAVERPSRLSTVQTWTIAVDATGYSGSTFLTYGQLTIGKWIADSVTIQALVATSNGTDVGEVYCDSQLNTPSGLVVLPSETNKVQFSNALNGKLIQWDWKHPDLSIGDTGIRIRIRLRRVSGTNDVRLINLTQLINQPSFVENATDDGNGRVL